MIVLIREILLAMFLIAATACLITAVVCMWKDFFGRRSMSDYIKREDALKALREHFTDDSDGIEADSFWHYKIVEEVLRELPTADVVEQKKGEWLVKRIDFSVMAAPGAYVIRSPTCSVCGYHAIEATNFCPHCGADMRKGGES